MFSIPLPLTTTNLRSLKKRINHWRGANKPYFFDYGIQVLGGDITIVAKSAESSESIDLERAKTAQAKVNALINSGEAMTNVLKYQRKLARAKNRIKIYGIR